MKKIQIEAAKDLLIKANDMMKDMPEDQTMKKSEVMNIVSALLGMINDVYSECMRRDSNIVNAINEWCEEHSENHMPELDKSQKRAILESAGIADQFEDTKTPIESVNYGIWASELPKSEAEKLNQIKITLK